MFQWDKTLKNLDVPAEQLLHLFRSMRDVQLALPGNPAQEASAYLCQYQAGGGVGTLVALHLHKSAQLAVYVDTPQEVAADHADRALDQALMFVESIGFLMNDLDIQLLSAADRTLLWEALPLQKGCLAEGKSPVARVPSSPAAKATVPPPAATREDSFKVAPSPVAVPATVTMSSAPVAEVDDLLAAVEAMRAGRPGVRPRKKIPSPEELRRRRQELSANVGRILASL
jgi:hypothetical protein